MPQKPPPPIPLPCLSDERRCDIINAWAQSSGETGEVIRFLLTRINDLERSVKAKDEKIKLLLPMGVNS